MAVERAFLGAAATVGMAVLLILLAGGAIFGLPSIYPLFYRRGAWAGSCPNVEACVAAHAGTKCCDAQLTHITMISSLCYFFSDACAAPWGEAVERVGARSMLALAVSCSLLGAVGLGLGVHFRTETLVTAALLLLALAGPGIFNASYTGCLKLLSSGGGRRLSASQRASLGTLLASLAAAAVDGSALTLRIIRSVSSHHGNILLASIAWAFVLGSVGAALLWCFHSSAEQPPPKLPEATEAFSTAPAVTSTGCLGCAKYVAKDGAKPAAESSGLLAAPAASASLVHTLFRRRNLLLVGFMASLNLSCTFYMQTMADQARALAASTPAAPHSTLLPHHVRLHHVCLHLTSPTRLPALHSQPLPQAA